MTTVRRTRRWRGAVALALFAGGIGVVTSRPPVLLAAIVGIAFAVYPHVGRTPSPDIAVERTLSDDAPARGESVEVSVTIRNDGDRTLPDVRIVDGVPPLLSVTAGSPRHAATLRPGSATTFSYAVDAVHGIHRFEPTTVIARDASGATEVELSATTETRLACNDDVPTVPLRRPSNHRPGRWQTDGSGDGVEFFRTREYRRGDPLSKIDWNRRARTGELATVEFREERSASVVLCLDARRAARRARPDEPDAVSLGAAAAQQLLSALCENRASVGVAAIGPEFRWLAPSGGEDQRSRARELLAAHTTPAQTEASNEVESSSERQVGELRQRLPNDVQVVFISPLADEFAERAALSLESSGHAVTVVSPNVTTTESLGGRLTLVERNNRIHALREAGVPVVDWDPDEPLGAVAARAHEQWSA